MSDRVSTSTNTKLQAGLVDTVLNSSVLVGRMLTSAAKWEGEKIRQPIKVTKNTQGGSFSGLDTFGTAAVDTRLNIEFPAKFFEKPVVIPLTELSLNQADPQRPFSLMSAEVKSTAQDMADDIATAFYGDGTGNSSKDFLGLEAIVDNGTNAATYGTQTRATSTTLNSTVTASGGSLSLAKMATLYNAVSSGAVKTSLGLTTETVFSLYEQLLQPQERIMKDVSVMRNAKGLFGSTGFTGLAYKGFPILSDEKCTSGVLYFVNEDFLEFRALPMAKTTPVPYRAMDIEGNDYTNVEGFGFSFSDWIIPSNQASVIGHIYLGGELWSSNPKRHGKLTGITSV